MKSLVLTITVLLGLLLVPAIEMKRKRCHKRPTVVECPDHLPSTCDHWNITAATRERYVGSTGILSCSAGHSLIGNASITCLESGVWSPISAMCVPNDISEEHVHSFSGSTYIYLQSRNSYENAKVACSSMCGTLVEINNEAENLFILSFLPENGFPYIGLESNNGIDYKWQSGNTTASNNFDDWATGQPPESITVGSCVGIFNLKWYDLGASCIALGRHAICESR